MPKGTSMRGDRICVGTAYAILRARKRIFREGEAGWR